MENQLLLLLFVLFPFFFFTVSFCFVLFFQTYWKFTSPGYSMGAYTHCKGSHLFDCYVSISRTLKIPFSQIVTLADLAHCKDSLYSDCNVSISRTVKILFGWIVTLVSRALPRFSSAGLLRQYLAHCKNSPVGLLHQYLEHCKDSLLLDCYVSILRIEKILFCWIVTLVSRAL